jgi:hypothetical protein
VIHSLLVVEMVAEPSHAMAGEDAEHVSLVVVKFRWRIATETQKFIAEESLNAGERQMCEFRTAVQQRVNALDKC